MIQIIVPWAVYTTHHQPDQLWLNANMIYILITAFIQNSKLVIFRFKYSFWSLIPLSAIQLYSSLSVIYLAVRRFLSWSFIRCHCYNWILLCFVKLHNRWKTRTNPELAMFSAGRLLLFSKRANFFSMTSPSYDTAWIVGFHILHTGLSIII